MIKNLRFTLPKIFIISLALQALDLVITIGIVFALHWWGQNNCFDAIYNDGVAIAWLFWAALGLFNLLLALLYLLRTWRGEVPVKSVTNLLIVALILINLIYFLPKESLLEALGCYFG